MKAKIKFFVLQLITDAIFGLVAALFAHLILCNIVPNILTLDFRGMINLSLTFPEQWYKLFSYWNCFLMLFGVRFIVAYLMGSYKYSETLGNQLYNAMRGTKINGNI